MLRTSDPGGLQDLLGQAFGRKPDIDPYNDLFCDLLEENAKAHPKYQGDCGDWLNWTVPDTDCNLPIFASGWGGRLYPVYFGYDAKGEICAVYVRFHRHRSQLQRAGIRRRAMELPKRARTADWENGVLTLDGEKKFEIPELTMELMERLAGYTLVGFHVKDYPATDELLIPFAGHKSMANFGVEDGALTDACFPVFSAMPKLRYLLLDGNAAIHGSALSALQGCKLDLITLNRTGLDDAGLLQAASIPKLSHIQIDHTAVTYEGLLAIAGNNRIEPVAMCNSPRSRWNTSPSSSGKRPKSPSSWMSRQRRNAAMCCPLSLPR